MYLKRKLGQPSSCHVCFESYSLVHPTQITCGEECRRINELAKRRAYYYSHRKRMIAQSCQNKKNPDGTITEKHKNAVKKWQHTHSETCRKYARDTYYRHREKILVQQKEYRLRKKKIDTQAG